MVVWLFSLLVFAVSYLAGIVGALTGLGGGVIIIPVLVLLFKVDIHYAMGASLISIIATSSGSSIAYFRQGYTNLKIGIFLESGAVVGALIGAYLVAFVPTSIIAIVLGVVLIFSAAFSIKKKEHTHEEERSHPWAISLQMDGEYPTNEGLKSYHVQRVPQALSLLTVAGIMSGLLGIGAGALKVLAMDKAMGLPYKVSTATSNFIIGITATVSCGIYLARGYIEPTIAFPVLLGVAIGGYSGAKIFAKLQSKILRLIFTIVILIVAVELIYKGSVGGL